MDASILIVGRDDFCQFILDAIQPSATLTLETAPNPQEAFPLIQAQQPDLVILSSQQLGILELCRNIRVNNRLTWMYCIAIDCVPSSLSSPFLSNLDSSDKLLQKQSNFLVEGADAFLALEASPTPVQQELLRAQVQAGLRRVQSHREIVRANDLLSAIALSDPLTELNNRRAFEWELPRQIHNARERNAPLSLLMLDVDFFKSINDQHGHLVGDRALKLISARLRHNLRFYDTPFRYGGEEFVIILNNTAAKEAQRIGQRLCQLIAQQAFNIDEQLELTITVSAGMASLRLDDDNKGTSLLRRADQYLLQAKSQGRNRILSAENEADVNVAMAEAEARPQQLNQIDVTPTSKNQN
ncbi:MAG: diguanylate cyclase [Elainellaceae cyanobacterium]